MMEKTGQLLIIDDNEDVLFALNTLLEPYLEKIYVSANPNKIESLMEKYHPDVILLDMNFQHDSINGKEGLFWLDKILQKDSQAVVILMTAYSDTEKAIAAIKHGAVDFISKPWEKEKLLATLSSALQLRASRTEITQLKTHISGLEQPLQIVGESEALKSVLNMIQKLSGTDANILILGENGTGKDLMAQYIYQNSPRANQIFTHIDLGSIPENLFESELFGYEKGAFTDAKKEKSGRLEVASGGTLFLNEITNLSFPMQAKLLSAIENKQISRIGSTKNTSIDVRFICATNADIHQMVDDGTFRQDLLYRINTIEINIPPLRERGNDVILLADFFLQRYAKKYKKPIHGITKDLKIKLLTYSWPGNIRELQHAVERAVILSSSEVLNVSDFLLQPTHSRRRRENEVLNLQQVEKETIEKALKRTNGNLSRAAELLGITRFSLYRKIEKLDSK